MKSNVVSLNSYKMNYQVGGDDSIADILNICEANFKKGLKNMAISSTHYHSLQQKLILSALQFFNLKYPHKKICTISFSCDSGNFQEFSAHATATKQAGVSSFGGQFDLISWQHLIENKIEKKFLNRYDIIFWELPEIEKLASMSEELQETLAKIEFVFIISNRLNSYDDIDFSHSISQYFLNHGIDISKILPSGERVKKAS